MDCSGFNLGYNFGGNIMSVHFESNSNEWETPQSLFNELNREFNFTLDVAASIHNHKCLDYFDKEDDGLTFNWHKHNQTKNKEKAGSIWMNPPYGREIGKWIKKAHEESMLGATIVCLIPARTDTTYWHDFIFGKAEIRFIKGRLKFGNSKNSAPFPSAIVIYKNQNRKHDET
jgi:phage N-6-adenine-methyltransferase